MKTLLLRWHRLRRKVLLHRRLAAALLAGTAVLAGLEAAAQQPPPTDPVWVAARDLPSGTVLAASDFRRADYAAGTAPDGVVSPEQLAGRTLAVPLHRGEPLTSGRAVGERLLEGRAGRAAVPVRVTDPAVAGLLRVGDRVDLVAVDPRDPGRRSIVPDVEVLALPKATREVTASSAPGRLVLVAASDETAETLAGLAVSHFVTVLWRD